MRFSVVVRDIRGSLGANPFLNVVLTIKKAEVV